MNLPTLILSYLRTPAMLAHLPTLIPSPPLGYERLITFVTDSPGHDLRYAIDPTKIRDELGWELKEDFKSGFRKTVLWYLNNREWTDRILSSDYKLDRLGNS